MSAIRCDSYQTGGSVTAVIYIKGHTIADIRPRGTTNQLVVDATVDGKPFTHTWYWAGETNPSSPKVDQGSVKVEITVPKMTKTMIGERLKMLIHHSIDNQAGKLNNLEVERG